MENVAPGYACTTESVRDASGGISEVSVPPSPGLMARGEPTGAIRLDVTVPDAPRKCSPGRIEISVDSLSDTLPGRSMVVRVTKREFIVRLRLRNGAGTADVASAISIPRRGFVASDPVRVAIK